MSLRTATLLVALICVVACALIAWLLVRDVAQPRIVAAQAPLALALIPGQGGQWLYVEAPADAVVACVGCALGPAQANGAVRTYTLRALQPGWQVTTTTTDGRTATLTHGSVVFFPLGGAR